MTYYLKYRSKNLEELDLENVRVSLEKIVKSGSIPHALLFSGPKGTGKTSAARIIAKIVNCEKLSNKVTINKLTSITPCNKCNQCISIARGENLDVLELDAASHRGIDDIRTLREAVKLAPAKANKKIYIIDEAHMLTTEASNALLKTLEEPPDHVMFILATTNPEKLIVTIRSRATNIVFTKARVSEIVRSLQRVVNGEKLKVEKGVLEMIAQASEGSFRDAVKTLEQLVSEKIKLSIKEVGQRLMQKNIFVAEEFLDILIKKDCIKALIEIDKYIKNGVSARFIISQLSFILRESLLSKIIGGEQERYDLSQEDTIYLIELLAGAFSQVPHSVMEQIPLELAVIKWCERGVKSQNSLRVGPPVQRTSGFGENSQELETELNTEKVGESGRDEIKAGSGKLQSEKHTPSKIKTVGNHANCLEDNVWSQILGLIRPKNASTEALLRASRPLEYDGKTLKLGVYYKFHKEHLESNPHISILETVAGEVLGSSTRVVCILTEPPVKKEIAVNKNEMVKTILPEANKDIDLVLTESKDEDIIKVAKEIFGS